MTMGISSFSLFGCDQAPIGWCADPSVSHRLTRCMACGCRVQGATADVRSPQQNAVRGESAAAGRELMSSCCPLRGRFPPSRSTLPSGCGRPVVPSPARSPGRSVGERPICELGCPRPFADTLTRSGGLEPCDREPEHELAPGDVGKARTVAGISRDRACQRPRQLRQGQHSSRKRARVHGARRRARRSSRADIGSSADPEWCRRRANRAAPRGGYPGAKAPAC